MNILATLQHDISKKLLDVALSAIGFFLALAINSWLDRRRDAGTYKSMLRSIRSEAMSNLTIFKESIDEYFDKEDCLVLRDFNFSVTVQAISTPLFISHTPDKVIQLLNDYIRGMSLSNSYRRAYEQLSLYGNKGSFERWGGRIIEAWRKTLLDMRLKTQKISALDESRTRKPSDDVIK
jgi:hypothetical protein